ncbi:MAG: serine protease, partial [Akkermansiaceae bacterium]|nr:serine protease [Akkermansiaceae bacterium]
MIFRCLPAVVAGSLLALAPPAVTAQAAAEIHASLRGSVIEVLVNQRLAGSGWLTMEPGFAFTASHVVPDRKSSVKVRLADGRLIAASVRARDAGHDALLLELSDKTGLPGGLPLAKAGPAPGDEIFLCGAPIFRHGVFLTGRVAREGLSFEWLGEQREAVECGHVTAATPKGVSGGGWVNGRGEVVGVQSGMMLQEGAPAGIG